MDLHTIFNRNRKFFGGEKSDDIVWDSYAYCHYVTDKHILLAIADKQWHGQVCGYGRVPTSWKFDLSNNPEYLGKLSVNRLTDVLDNKISYDFQEFESCSNVRICKECDGMGQVDWSYEDKDNYTHHQWFDCPICYGAGEIHTDMGDMIYDRAYSLKHLVVFNQMGTLAWSPYYLYQVSKVAIDADSVFMDVYKVNEYIICLSLCDGDLKMLLCGMEVDPEYAGDEYNFEFINLL